MIQKTLPDSNFGTICDYAEYLTFLEGEFDFNEIPQNEKGDPIVNPKDIIQELNERLSYYGDFCPYAIEKFKIVRTDFNLNKNIHYLFCLYYALYGGANNKNKASDIFEYITDSALKGYINTDCSILTSFSASEDRTMQEKVHSIIRSTNELIGNINYMPAKAKDGGVDIVTYKPCDKRGNQIIILTDATIGKNWTNKCMSPKLDAWKEYISFKVHPITCVSTVHVVDKDSLHYQSKGKGLIFDRTRIIKYFKINNDLEKMLLDWRNEIH